MEEDAFLDINSSTFLSSDSEESGDETDKQEQQQFALKTGLLPCPNVQDEARSYVFSSGTSSFNGSEFASGSGDEEDDFRMKIIADIAEYENNKQKNMDSFFDASLRGASDLDPSLVAKIDNINCAVQMEEEMLIVDEHKEGTPNYHLLLKCEESGEEGNNNNNHHQNTSSNADSRKNNVHDNINISTEKEQKDDIEKENKTEIRKNQKKKKLKKGGLFHPCIAQHGTCKYGEKCLLKYLPGDTCIPYVMSFCHFQSLCRFRHAIDDQDIRDLVFPNKCTRNVILSRSSGDTYVVEPCEKGGKIQVATYVIKQKEYTDGADETIEHGSIDHPPYLLPAYSTVEACLPPPSPPPPPLPPSAPVVFTGPTPYLDVVRKGRREEDKLPINLKSPAPANVAKEKRSEKECIISPARPDTPAKATLSEDEERRGTRTSGAPGSAASVKLGRHPCVAVYGTCRYGEGCSYADYPSNYCLCFLKGHCKLSAESCPFRHDAPESYLKEKVGSSPPSPPFSSQSNTSSGGGKVSDPASNSVLLSSSSSSSSATVAAVIAKLLVPTAAEAADGGATATSSGVGATLRRVVYGEKKQEYAPPMDTSSLPLCHASIMGDKGIKEGGSSYLAGNMKEDSVSVHPMKMNIGTQKKENENEKKIEQNVSTQWERGNSSWNSWSVWEILPNGESFGKNLMSSAKEHSTPLGSTAKEYRIDVLENETLLLQGEENLNRRKDPPPIYWEYGPNGNKILTTTTNKSSSSSSYFSPMLFSESPSAILNHSNNNNNNNNTKIRSNNHQHSNSKDDEEEDLDAQDYNFDSPTLFPQDYWLQLFSKDNEMNSDSWMKMKEGGGCHDVQAGDISNSMPVMPITDKEARSLECDGGGVNADCSEVDSPYISMLQEEFPAIPLKTVEQIFPLTRGMKECRALLKLLLDKEYFQQLEIRKTDEVEKEKGSNTVKGGNSAESSKGDEGSGSDADDYHRVVRAVGGATVVAAALQEKEDSKNVWHSAAPPSSLAQEMGTTKKIQKNNHHHNNKEITSSGVNPGHTNPIKPLTVTAVPTLPVSTLPSSVPFPSADEVKKEKNHLLKNLREKYKQGLAMEGVMSMIKKDAKLEKEMNGINILNWDYYRSKAYEMKGFQISCFTKSKEYYEQDCVDQGRDESAKGQFFLDFFFLLNRLAMLLLEETRLSESTKAGELYLHCFQEKEVEEILYRWIKLCAKMKEKELKIVTGLGKQNRDKPVLFTKLLSVLGRGVEMEKPPMTKMVGKKVKLESPFLSLLQPIQLQLIEVDHTKGFLRVGLVF